jgi:hypothetical protein
MDQVTLPRATVQQALHVATAAAYPVALIATLRAALEQPDRAQKMRDAGHTRRPTLREMAEPVQPEQPEQAVPYAVWRQGFDAVRKYKQQQQQPEPPPEAQTEAERLTYCAGWWAAMEQKREQPAQEPVALFDARLRAWRG